MSEHRDPEIAEFKAALLSSIGEAKRDEHAAVHTPAQIEARKRGRPAGSTRADAKVSTTIRLDAAVLEALKAAGPGWQTRAKDALREVFVAKATPGARPRRSRTTATQD
ncbi:BrnA antitoxin family protein [Variovorax sp. YR566]|uniref:BrnA antitoxin family protein n=1 Tax=Variovorax sp. YR566 TaxID=3450237 RepID=UPI003F80E9EF